jgi:uncharacterized protein with PIN domain
MSFKLFSWGKKDAQKAIVLGPMLSEILTPDEAESQEIIVMGDAAAATAIAAAETRLEALRQAIDTDQAERVAAAEAQERVLELEQQLAAAIEEHAQTTAAFEAFKKEPAAEHTTIAKQGDDMGSDAKPLADYQLEEQKVRQRASKAAKK